jgi:hypothetical protein
VWLKLKIRLQQRVEVLNTADKLSAAIKDIWENLSVDYIQGLYHSIPKRLRKDNKKLLLFPEFEFETYQNSNHYGVL